MIKVFGRKPTSYRRALRKGYPRFGSLRCRTTDKGEFRKIDTHPSVAVYPLVGPDDPAAAAIAPEMLHHPQIGIYRSCEFRRLLFSATSAIDIEHLPETADHTMARIDPSGLDIAADEQYAPVGALQVNFVGMKRQMQLLAQKIADYGNQRFQITGILVHDIKSST